MATHLSKEDKLYIYGLLRINKLVDPIWPVYSWDTTPTLLGLLVSDDHAYEFVAKVADIDLTKKQFQGVLKAYDIIGFPSPFATRNELIEEFHRTRKDRRIRPAKVSVATLVPASTFQAG